MLSVLTEFLQNIAAHVEKRLVWTMVRLFNNLIMYYNEISSTKPNIAYRNLYWKYPAIFKQLIRTIIYFQICV